VEGHTGRRPAVSLAMPAYNAVRVWSDALFVEQSRAVSGRFYMPHSSAVVQDGTANRRHTTRRFQA
jgi:hypothetical protein